MPDDVVAMVDDRYEKLKDGDRVPYEVASMFHSENDGFTMKFEQGERALGIIREGSVVKVLLYDIHEDGDTLVEQTDSFGLVIDNRTERDLVHMIEAAGYEPLPMAEDDEDGDVEDLDYLG